MKEWLVNSIPQKLNENFPITNISHNPHTQPPWSDAGTHPRKVMTKLPYHHTLFNFHFQWPLLAKAITALIRTCTCIFFFIFDKIVINYINT